ncbi:unnamed protein product [Brassica rapa subsp. trilocularis]
MESSILFQAIVILWLLWLVYAILVDLIIVEAVKSIYLTSNKAKSPGAVSTIA